MPMNIGAFFGGGQGRKPNQAPNNPNNPPNNNQPNNPNNNQQNADQHQDPNNSTTQKDKKSPLSLDNYSDLWDATQNQDQDNSNANNGNPDNSANLEANRGRLKDWIKTQNLFGDIDMVQFGKDLEAGNINSLNAHLREAFEGAFEKTLYAMNQMGTEFMDRAVQRAVSQAGTTFNSTQAISQLHEQLPYTSQKAIKPMAEAIMSQFLERNNGDPKIAVRETVNFFKAFQKTMSGGGEIPSDSFPFRRPMSSAEPNLGNGASQSSGQGKVPNFMALFKGEEE